MFLLKLTDNDKGSFQFDKLEKPGLMNRNKKISGPCDANSSE